MKLYGYDPSTGEFGGETRPDDDPLGGGLLIPAFTTETPPPETLDKEAAVWNGSAWSVVPDRRGEVWYDTQRLPRLVAALGDPVSEGLTEEPRGLTTEEQWAELRARRNALLTASDWTQIADAPLTEGQRTAWSAYRQALRDIPQTPEAPDDIVWPEAPA